MTRRGRPTIKTDDIVREFCERVALGRSLLSVCADHDMPCQSTIFLWKWSDSDFSEKLARARAERDEAYAEQIRAIGRRVIEDDTLDPTRARVAVDAFEKAAKLVQPKTNRVEMTGKDGGPIQTENMNPDVASALDEIASKLASRGDAPEMAKPGKA